MEEMTSATPDQSGIESPQQGSILNGGSQGGFDYVDALAFDPSWLPEELQAEPSLGRFDSVDKLAKSYVHLVKHMGVDPEHLMRIPQDDSPEAWNEIYQRLGRPESPQQYDLPEFDGAESYKEFAYQHNLTQNQAEAVLDAYVQLTQGNEEAEQQSWQQTQIEYRQQLMQEFGRNFEQEAEFAERSFRQFADEDALNLMDETGLGNHPAIVKMFAKIGRLLSEDGMLGPKDGVLGGLNSAQAEQLIQQRLADPEFKAAYTSKYHPNHAEAVQEMTRLYSYTA